MSYSPFFIVKVTTRSKDRLVLGKSDGTTEELPEGYGLAGKISVTSEEYKYPDIIDILKILRSITNIGNRNIEKYDQIIKDLGIEEANTDKSITWNNRINKLQHKLESLKYHMDKFRSHEIEIENRYRNEYTNTITNLEELDPNFTYEVEAFLFQVKSSLDILSQIIGLAWKLNGVVTYGDDGNDLIDKLQKTSSFRDFQDEKDRISLVIRNNARWISYLVNMRDLITHFSDLINFQSHTHEASFSEFARIYYPKMPDDKRAFQYMEETWTHLINLINDISFVLQEMYKKIT